MRKSFSRPLVLSCDNAYAPATLVCLTSVFLNSPGIDFDTYWLTTNRGNSAYNPEVIAAVEKISDMFARRVQFVPTDDSCFENFIPPKLLPYLGNVTYNWLLIPSLIECGSFLLLDSDVIVQENLDYLFSLDIGDKMIAGVSNGTEGENTRLGLPAPDEEYINTGVMIVNAARWRKEHVFDSLMEWYARNSKVARLGDQDIINAVLLGRKVILDRKWNTQLHTFSAEDLEAFEEKTFRGIFHFSGACKPWHASAHERPKALYENYARFSPLRMSYEESE